MSWLFECVFKETRRGRRQLIFLSILFFSFSKSPVVFLHAFDLAERLVREGFEFSFSLLGVASNINSTTRRGERELKRTERAWSPEGRRSRRETVSLDVAASRERVAVMSQQQRVFALVAPTLRGWR